MATNNVIEAGKVVDIRGTEDVTYRLVPGIEGYATGTDWSVWTRWRRVGLKMEQGDWREVKQHENARGYKTISGWLGDRPKTLYSQTLIALSHLGPRPKGNEIIRTDETPLQLAYRPKTRKDESHSGEYRRTKPYGIIVPADQQTELRRGKLVGQVVLVGESKDGVVVRRIPRCPSRATGTDGTAWRQKHDGSWVLMSQRLILKEGKYPYYEVSLPIGTGWPSVWVHRLILESHVGPCPEGMQALHNNDIGTENLLENLRWGTIQENADDRERNGGNQHGELHPNSLFSNATALEIRKEYWGHSITQEELAARYETTKGVIGDIVRGNTYRTAGGPISNDNFTRTRSGIRSDSIDHVELRNANESGVSEHQLAKQHRVSRSTIHRLLRKP